MKTSFTDLSLIQQLDSLFHPAGTLRSPTYHAGSLAFFQNFKYKTSAVLGIGLTLERCPHKPGSEKFDAWWAGYDRAEAYMKLEIGKEHYEKYYPCAT